MKIRSARRLVVATFLLYTLALTWPGVLPFNTVRPFVLGLPFAFFWVVLWVVLGGIALWVADRAYARAADSDADAAELPDGGGAQ